MGWMEKLGSHSMDEVLRVMRLDERMLMQQDRGPRTEPGDPPVLRYWEEGGARKGDGEGTTRELGVTANQSREPAKRGSLVPLVRAGLLEPSGQTSDWNEFKKNKGRKMAASM